MCDKCVQEKRVTNIEHDLYGNGRPGLKQDVTQIKNDLMWLKRIGGWIAGMLAVIIAGLILAGVQYLTKL